VPLFVLRDRVRCTPFVPFVGVDARPGVRFGVAVEPGEFALALRPVEPGGGGFRVGVEDMLSVLGLQSRHCAPGDSSGGCPG
jgi:hypothetical protein